MFRVIVPETTMYVNVPRFPGSTHTGTISAAEYLAGLAAIDDAYTTDCATLKARFGRRCRWPREAYDLEMDAQARYDTAFDALDAAYRGVEVAS